MPFGPSGTESFLIFWLPLIGSFFICMLLLFSWRKFLSLLFALAVTVMWGAIGIASLGSIVGAFMLLFIIWFLFVSLLIAYLRTRNGDEKYGVPAPKAREPDVKCPACGKMTPSGSLGCIWCNE